MFGLFETITCAYWNDYPRWLKAAKSHKGASEGQEGGAKKGLGGAPFYSAFGKSLYNVYTVWFILQQSMTSVTENYSNFICNFPLLRCGFEASKFQSVVIILL